MIEIPFVFGEAVEGVYFTDREEEREHLIQNFKYGVNSIIISPRRWGKSSLVKQVASELASETNLKIVMMDAFACRTPEDFYRMFATEVIKQTSNKVEEWLINAKRYLSSLVPLVSVTSDPYQPLSLSLKTVQKDFGKEVLELPERIAKEKNIRIVICIDEIQQIGEFTDSLTFQKELRTVWQHQRLTKFCLYGSKRHMLMKMFGAESFPFYKFGETIFLQRIPVSYWQDYIISHFAQDNKQIDATLVEQMYEYADGNSSYMQQLSWLLWLRTQQEATLAHLTMAQDDLNKLCAPIFQEQLQGLSAYQLHLLRAVADGKGDSLSHKDVIEEYDLGSSANVNRLRKTLIDKELLDTENGKLIISDPILRHWLQMNFNG